MLCLFVVAIADAVHGFAASKDITDGVVHWVVEQSSEGSLVGSYVCGITVEVLSHLENSGGLAILRPEVLADFRDRIDADAIEVVLVDNSLDPVLEVLSNVAVVLIKIGEASETAVLYGVLVTPVDIAIVVIVLSLVQGVKLIEIVSDGAGVVGDDVDHHPDVFVVGGRDEGLQIIGTTEVAVEVLPIASPVSVVSPIDVVDDG